MSRVELLAAGTAPLTARRYYEYGDPGPVVAAMATVPELLEVCLPFLSAVLGASSLDARTKELVIVRTSVLLECDYCVNSHSVVALDTGLTIEEVRGLRGEGPAVAADEREDALLGWVDAVAGGRGAVEDTVAARVGRCFADHEVVALTLLVGATMMLNRFCTALELPTSPEVCQRLAAAGLR
ncbi:MAG: carboxymuconolactone decarboxylase family protein [Geodermatophilaceae bacterium]